MKKIAVVISCEHATDAVPEAYLNLFKPWQELLTTHRGIDFGALEIAQYMQKKISCNFVQATATRLLIDCNRSLGKTGCFSEVTQGLPQTEKQKIIDCYYTPFREHVFNDIATPIAQGLQVIHLSIHSFTPVINGTKRHADIGLLYDPQRVLEKKLARQWQLELKHIAPEYHVRMNYPYKGTSDGFTTFLRQQFTPAQYIGIEVESNQSLTTNDRALSNLKNILTLSLLKILC